GVGGVVRRDHDRQLAPPDERRPRGLVPPCAGHHLELPDNRRVVVVPAAQLLVQRLHRHPHSSSTAAASVQPPTGSGTHRMRGRLGNARSSARQTMYSGSRTARISAGRPDVSYSRSTSGRRVLALLMSSTWS